MAAPQQDDAFSEAYAAEVLDRIDDSGFKQDVAETDLLGSTVSETFRAMCTQLADTIAAASAAAPPPQSKNSLEGAVAAVQKTAGSEDSARGGRLDTALLRLLRSLDPGSRATQRIQVVEELVGYLQAARLLAAAAQSRQPPTEELAALAADGAAAAAGAPQEMEIDGETAAVSAGLHALAAALQVARQGRGGGEVIAEMGAQAEALLAQLPASYQQPLLSRESLTEAQLQQLGEIDAGLRAEHMLRRHMLTERAKVTLQSFLWSKRLKECGTEAEAAAAAARGEAAMMAEPGISVEDIFTFRRADLAAMGAKVTSGTGGGASASVKGVLIGAVPDRGGRAEGREAQALANMPAFAARKGGPAGGGGRGRGGGERVRSGGDGDGGGGAGGGSGRHSGRGGGKRHRNK